MNTSIAATIDRAEKVTASLRALADLPEASHFCFSGDDLYTTLIQLFPDGLRETPEGHHDLAKPLARALGGNWTTQPNGSWECTAPTFPGLERTKICIHYVEPKAKIASPFVDLT